MRGVITDSAGYLLLQNGTLRIGGTFSLTNRTFTLATGTVIPANAGLWLDNPNYTVAGVTRGGTSSRIVVGGLLRISQGIFNIGVAAGDGLDNLTSSTFQIEGGTINAAGRFQPQNACTYIQSGGTVNVATVGNSRSNFGSFELFSASNTFTMTGGTINLINRNTAGTLVDFNIFASSYSVTGGMVVFGGTGAPATLSYVNTGAILPNFTVNPGKTLNTNVTSLFVGSSITNNGAIASTGASARIDFGASGPMSYSGTGTFGTLVTPFPAISSASTELTTLTSPLVTSRVNLFSGGFLNSNLITLGNSGASTTTVQVGLTGNTTPGGSFDVSPNHNQGTGGQSILYLSETTPRTTGFEINPTRILSTLTIDNANNVTLAGGDLSLSGTTAALTLTSGRFITGNNTLTLVSGAATVTRTLGRVDGNLRKTYSAAASKVFEVGTANGYSPVTVNATAGTFPTTITVKAIQSALPAFTDPSKALQRYWSVQASGITANLTFQYLGSIDVPATATEASMVLFKYDGAALTQPGGTLGPALDRATINGVTSFSDWTLAEPAAAFTPTATATATATATSTETATFTPMATETVTTTPTGTSTETPTDTATSTSTDTVVPTSTLTGTATSTPTDTATSTILPTETATYTPEPTATPTDTPTSTPSPSATSTSMPSLTITSTSTSSSTLTATQIPSANIIINELDADQTNTDTGEFIELYDGGTGNTSLNGLVVVLYNGSNDLSYAAFDLDGFTTNGLGYFTLGNSAVLGVDRVFANDTLQNGQDAAAIYIGTSTDFPNNTPVTTTNLLDAIVYDTSDADDPGLLVLLNPGQPQVDENAGGSGIIVSNQRCPNGSGGARNTSTYTQSLPSPDSANPCVLPTSTATVTSTSTSTMTSTPTSTPTETLIPIETPTATFTLTATTTSTETATETASATPTTTQTNTVTPTVTSTATLTTTPTLTSTITSTPSQTSSATGTSTSTHTATTTPTLTPTLTHPHSCANRNIHTNPQPYLNLISNKHIHGDPYGDKHSEPHQHINKHSYEHSHRDGH